MSRSNTDKTPALLNSDHYCRDRRSEGDTYLAAFSSSSTPESGTWDISVVTIEARCWIAGSVGVAKYSIEWRERL